MGHVKARKPLIESVEVYPAGRGHILALVKKRIPPKTKKYKHKQPRFAHTRIQMNPEDLTITEYLSNGNRKHIYIFPEGKQLQHQERQDLALSLLATLPTPRYLGKGETIKSSKYPIFLSTQQRKILKQKWKRYIKWRKKH